MSLVGQLYVGALATSALACLSFVWIAWRRREKTGADPLAALALSAAIWCVANVGTYVGSSQLAGVSLRFQYLGVTLATTTWLVFAMEYTGYEKYVDWRLLSVLAIEPLAVQAFVWTNDFHRLFWESITFAGGAGVVDSVRGPAFWGHTVYSYLLLAAGVGLFARMLYRRDDLYRGQAALLAAGIVVSWAFNVFSISGVVPVDISAIGFAIAAALFLGAMSRYEFMDVTPVARATVVENIDDGVIVLDEDDRVVDVNRTGKRILDVGDRPVIGTHAEAVLADSPDIWEHVAGLEEGRREVAVETEAGQRVYEVQASPLQAGRRGPGGRLFLVHDVTDRKRRERELRRQNEQLDQFASLVSHDLRNPLNVADGYVEAAMDAEDLETAHDFLEEVGHSHGRMGDIIDDVLTLTREGRAVEAVEPTDLGAVARDAWENVDTKDATLVVEETREIRADADRLLRAFENLCRNAVEHGGEEVTVRVGAIGESDPGSVIDAERRGFYVEDDGPGIPADERDSVLEDGYTTAPEGTGLGLSIVGSIVEAHGWDLAVTESESGGARLEVSGVTLAATGTDRPAFDGERSEDDVPIDSTELSPELRESLDTEEGSSETEDRAVDSG